MWLFTVGPPTGGFRKTLGMAAECVFGVTPWLEDMEVGGGVFRSAREFGKLFRERFGYEADYHAASGAADVLAFTFAVEKANSLDPKKERDALTGLDVERLCGRVKFDSTGQISMSQVLIQIQDGKVVPVLASGKRDWIPIDTKIEIINALSGAGIPEIQVTPFVHPKATPQMADAEEVMTRITRVPGIQYQVLVPNVGGLQRALACKPDRVERDARQQPIDSCSRC
jgi:hypothetical protein